MAVRKVGARVELDGEREYKEALKELNTGNATLRTEMQKLQAEFKGQENSTEALTKKGDLLQRQLQQQQDKVKQLQDAVKNSAQQYGEADERTQKWIQQLNKAEAEQFSLEHQLDETNAALQGQGEEMVGLGDTVSNLTEKFGVHLPQGITNALNSMNSFSAGTVAAMGAAVAAIAGVVEAVKALHENAVAYAAEADEIMTRSLVTNLSTTLLQELEYAAPLIDVDVNTITGSMTKLTKEMADAAAGNESLQDSFKALGVSITTADGSLRSSQDVFFEIIDALGEMGNDTERDAMAMSLLGKSAQELNPLIKQGTDTLREYMSAADENYVLTEDQIEALGELDDAVQTNELRWESLKKQLAAQFAPTSTKVLETFGKMVEKSGKALIDSKIIEGVGEVLQMLLEMFKPLTDLLTTADGAPGRLRPLYEILHGIAYVIAAVGDGLEWVVGLFQTLNVFGGLSGMKSGLERMGNAVGFGYNSGNANSKQRLQMQRAGTLDQYESYYSAKANGFQTTTWEDAVDPKNLWVGTFNATGNDNWRGGLTWVGENGPELVSLPAGSQIHSAQESRSFGGDTFYITIDAKSVKEFNDIVEMAHSARSDSWMR